jgi:hypothetical protein
VSNKDTIIEALTMQLKIEREGNLALVRRIAELEKPVYVDSSRFSKSPSDHKPGMVITAPVHAIDTSQEHVDETAKCGHEFECPRCGHCCKEWVGLDGDIPGLGLVTEEFYNGMLCAEDILRKRNT